MKKESSGMHVKATGDYAETAKRSQAPMQNGALDPMSDGSMNYLAHNDKNFKKDVAKVRRSKCEY